MASAGAAPVAARANEPSPIPHDSVDLTGTPPIPQVVYDGKTRTATFLYDADGRNSLKNLVLIGSWDKNTGRYSIPWEHSAVPMTKQPDGTWIAQVPLVNDAAHPWQWGVTADSPRGRGQWAIFEEDNLPFTLEGDHPTQVYAPTQETRMGAGHQGNAATFKYFAPDARDVQVKIWDATAGQPVLVPLAKDPKSGMWTARVDDGWKRFEGKLYSYQVVTAEGDSVERVDPYARFREGEQRGLSELFLHPVTGQEVHRLYEDPVLKPQGKPSRVEFIRFEVQGHDDASSVSLVLRDDAGQVMDKTALLRRLSPGDPELVHKFHGGQFSDYWGENIDDQGRIHLVRQGHAWAAILNHPEALAGLHYTFEVRRSDGSLVGDADGDGTLSPAEARQTAFNDPYDNVISPKYGWERRGLIRESSFQWQNDDVPRMAPQREKWRIYQLHVGSVLGDGKNVHRSTFADVMGMLGYLKDLGINTLEMLPVNAFEGARDWGYVGSNNFAVSDQYGFEDENGRWVCGMDAVKRLVDMAHGQGFNVLNDVVYNHWGLNYNDLYETDGKKNPYYDWGTDPNAPAALKPGEFGPLPAYNKDQVRQFIVDSANEQLDELHFDGIRFDYTHPIHDPNGGGGTDGWTLLRKINRELHFFHPNAYVNAEEFPNSEVITKPSDPRLQGGAGFDTMWNTEFQHRLVHANGEPSILQQAVQGQQTNMDRFMDYLTNHPGFTTPMNGVTIVSDHDEVGNADRTINVAMNYQDGLPTEWARDAARTTFGIGMLSPGIPMFFQGEESLANNGFKWGVPSTWDVGWDWRNAQASSGTLQQLLAQPQSEARDKAAYDIMRKLHFTFCKDAIHLRDSTPAFDGDASVSRVYTHNDNSVLAFSRKKGNDEYLVVASLNKNDQPNYNLPLAGGRWALVLNSDDPQYGGRGFGTKPQVDGFPGTTFDIPKAGLLVYKRVG